MSDLLAQRLKNNEVIIIDGATGTEAEKRGAPMNDDAWSVAVVDTHPEVIRAVHIDYIEAGADLITTNTFATSRHTLEYANLGHRFEALNAKAARLACEARDQAADRPIAVAGSISTSTFGKGLPDYALARANFEAQADILAENGVDLFILEMMRDIPYTQIVLDACARTGLPIWVGFSLGEHGDERLLLYSGDATLAEGARSILTTPGSLVAIMHTLTEWAVPSIEAIQAEWDGPIGAYPHSGTFVMPNWQFNDVISPAEYLVEAQKWVGMGVQVVGGCCGIGPEHIRLLKERLPSHI